MFDCILTKRVLKVGTPEVVGCYADYKMKIPFVPNIGLHIISDRLRAVVNNVVWNNDTRFFILATEDAFPSDVSEINNPNDFLTYESWRELLIFQGWSLSEEIS